MTETCSRKDMRYMGIAGYEASKSAVSFRHGCVAVVSGKIVARGCNSYRTYSNDGMISQTCTCHAEVEVLRQCKKQNITKKINMYVGRSSNTGELLCSAPCIDCFLKMKEFNIRSIIYVNHDGDIAKRSVEDFNTNHTTSGHRAIKSKRVKTFV